MSNDWAIAQTDLIGERSDDAREPPRQAVSKSANVVLSRTPYTTIANLIVSSAIPRKHRRRPPLYSAQERQRRDASRWTTVQGVLAPVQFLIFLVSLALVVRYLATGEGFLTATLSVVVKTLALYAIMITGSIWERAVFGRYLFAPAFFWEDVFSMLVLALHTAYLAALVTGALGQKGQMILALAAYATYLINATQFVLKLRAARLDRVSAPEPCSEIWGAVP